MNTRGLPGTLAPRYHELQRGKSVAEARILTTSTHSSSAVRCASTVVAPVVFIRPISFAMNSACCSTPVTMLASTEGLPGPGILSDRPYLPGSLLHYRFGAFRGVAMLGNDGSHEAMLVAPDGSLVLDQRKPWFTPPQWAPRLQRWP